MSGINDFLSGEMAYQMPNGTGLMSDQALGAGFSLPSWQTNVASPAGSYFGQMTPELPSTLGSAVSGGSMWDNFLGKPGQQGWGSLALGAASGLMNGFMGMKQLSLGKKTLEQNRRQFDLNFAAQQKMTNSRLEDRQRARNAGTPGFHMSTEDYMKKYGI